MSTRWKFVFCRSGSFVDLLSNDKKLPLVLGDAAHPVLRRSQINRSRRPDKFLRYILPQIEGTLEEDESRKFSFTVFMTTESCTATSLMTSRNLRALCPNLKNNKDEHLLSDFVKCTWMNTTGLNGLYFCFRLYGCSCFRISAYAALKMKNGIRWCSES